MVDINSYEKYFLFIKGEIEEAFQKLTLNKTPDYLYEPIQYVINGKGKRLRPILVHLVGQAYSANPADLMKVGIAVELLHNFTLVHDDIMDGDDTRHGQKSVHNKWDDSTAILSGDALFVLAQLSLKGLSDFIHQRFNEVALTICEGQGMDKEFENNSSISMGKYLIMIGKKTGALLGLCAELGALLGGVSKEDAHNLFEFGLNLGLAFQIQDDFLEIFGHESNMGKSLGSDIFAGKQTALMILARDNNSNKWEEFVNTKNSISDYQSYFVKNGIKTGTETIIQHYIYKAEKGLKVINQKKRNHLRQFTTMILNRTY